MLGGIYIGLSGMNAYSKGLQTISNNVANLNTAGFKATTVTFTDQFSSGGGGLTFTANGIAQHSGTGVRIDSPLIDFSQGDLRQTENDLDLAVQGNGFLVLLRNGSTFYTRTGQFALDKDGFIIQTGTDYRLAVLDSANQPVAVNLDSKRTNPPVATTKIVFNGNLSKDATLATVANVNVFDSRGGKHVWTIKFTKPASIDDEWTVTVTDETGSTVDTSTLKFLGGGIVDPSTSTLTITDNPAGADRLSVTLDFSANVSSNIQGQTSTIQASSVDGNGVGTLTTVTIDDDGKIKLTYSNEKTEAMGAIAIADFRDQQELQRIGDGVFRDAGNGEVRLLASGQEGIGKLLSKQIEASNVDLSQEFGELILIQRGFQACSQVVSVTNDMIQQLFGVRGQQ